MVDSHASWLDSGWIQVPRPAGVRDGLWTCLAGDRLMASIPGFRFDITGASGSQNLLSPKASWRCFVLPRGAYASQDSTGTLITFDSASVASRFAVNDWIQAGLLTANIRQVGSVGGNSLNVSGAALTVSENQRILLIGSTEPTVTGGSATYTTPNTIVRDRKST